MPVGLGRQLRKVKAIQAEDNIDVPIDYPAPCGQEPPEENFHRLFLLLLWL